MSTPRQSPIHFAWKSAYHTCKAVFQWCYSSAVLLLICATAFAAYVATLDYIPVPNFLIRLIQDNIKTQGMTLSMKGIRFQPNGRVLIQNPKLHSPELGSTIIEAETVVAKLKLSYLIFGGVAVEEISIASGRVITPAMLTPTGEPITAIDAINFEASQRGPRWTVHYANLTIGGLKFSAAGRVDDSLIQIWPEDPNRPKRSVTQTILYLAPKIAKLSNELQRLEFPFLVLDLDVENGKQTAQISGGARSLTPRPDLKISNLLLRANYQMGRGLTARLVADRADLPQGIRARSLNLRADWQDATPPRQVLPNRIQASATNIEYRSLEIPSLFISAHPGTPIHRASVQTALPESPIVVTLRHHSDRKTTEIDLAACLDATTLSALNPLAIEIAKLDIGEMASLDKVIDLHARATLDASFQLSRAEAFVQSGPATVLGAHIDHAALRATLDGPQIELPEIRVQAGEQKGVIEVGYNLDTLLRRVLVEGSFDPNLINGWFKPWWTAMWEGMSFPQKGMLTYLDSQAIFKRPETVFVTGIAYASDLDLRGLQVDELRTRIFSRFHYVDLYDLELATTDGQQAIGQIQFHMDRDKRDEKDKLTGIWIDALSTLDVKKAPQILWEIADASRSILEPYCYELPPFIEARSSSVRHLDEYRNDINLLIETETDFSFYGFPFDSLVADVHIGDDLIDIPRAEAQLGGGQVSTSAFIVGDKLQVDAQLDSVSFGQALDAANTYFARSGSESAQSMDTDRLLNLGGKIDASFQGSGFVGDALSFIGDGQFHITGADLGSFRMFGLLSMALELTPLRFTTLKFSEALANITVERELVRFAKGKIQGEIAAIDTNGTYNIETDAVAFSAKLFPFRNNKVPIIGPLINLPLSIFSNALEIAVSGTFDQPQLSLANPSTEEQINVTSPRNNRPARR